MKRSRQRATCYINAAAIDGNRKSLVDAFPAQVGRKIEGRACCVELGHKRIGIEHSERWLYWVDQWKVAGRCYSSDVSIVRAHCDAAPLVCNRTSKESRKKNR